MATNGHVAGTEFPDFVSTGLSELDVLMVRRCFADRLVGIKMRDGPNRTCFPTVLVPLLFLERLPEACPHGCETCWFPFPRGYTVIQEEDEGLSHT